MTTKHNTTQDIAVVQRYDELICLTSSPIAPSDLCGTRLVTYSLFRNLPGKHQKHAKMFNKIATVCVLLLAIVAVAFAQNTTSNATTAAPQPVTTASGADFVQPEMVMLLLAAVAAFFR
ncbi:uncharacterized protein LOC144907004 isoform X2 [Branchiostoma floridae x Branchiostoma belcheri]